MSGIFRIALLIIFNLAIIATECSAKPADTVNTITLPLSKAGYAIEGGAWRAYFLTSRPGELHLALSAKTTQNVTIHVRVDHDAKTSVRLTPSAGYVTTSIDRAYHLTGTGYHFVEIEPAGGDKSLPDVASIILSGPAAEGVKYNTSDYKGAPATHLHYIVPKDTVAAWFYSEIYVPKEADNSVNAYYETNGFSGGYMGIQHNSKDERRIIFSIWSNFKTDDYKEIPAEYAVKLVKKGNDVFTGGFGNEGSGGHSHLVFNWKPDVVYKLLVGAKPAGDHTIYTAYYFAPENGKWQLIAQWDKTKTGGKLLTDLYSFVENFGDNGMDYFSAYYGNQWICTPSGKWLELTTARFTTTANQVKHPRFDYGCGTKGKWFYMFSGGFKKVGNTPYGTMITREPTGQQPVIDFAALPEQ
jgi:hypothetical protein